MSDLVNFAQFAHHVRSEFIYLGLPLKYYPVRTRAYHVDALPPSAYAEQSDRGQVNGFEPT